VAQYDPAIKMERCETPILTPEKYLQSHLNNNFNLLSSLSNCLSKMKKQIILKWILKAICALKQRIGKLCLHVDMKFPMKEQMKEIFTLLYGSGWNFVSR